MTAEKGISIQITCPHCDRTTRGYMTRVTNRPRWLLKTEYHNSGLDKSMCKSSGYNFEPNQTWKNYIDEVMDAGGRADNVKMPYDVEAWSIHKLWRILRKDRKP